MAPVWERFNSKHYFENLRGVKNFYSALTGAAAHATVYCSNRDPCKEVLQKGKAQYS
jgi:hypothetical protein